MHASGVSENLPKDLNYLAQSSKTARKISFAENTVERLILGQEGKALNTI